MRDGVEMTKKILAVIPARGGSKRIPGKNIRIIHGKPMLEWVIGALKDFNRLGDIIVSTDSSEISAVAQRLGVSAPFVRPPELSHDFATTAAVIKHAASWYSCNVGAIDYVLTVYATAIFLSPNDLEAAYQIISAQRRDVVFSGCSYPFPIQRAVFMHDDGAVEMFQPEMKIARSQDLQPAFHDAGQFYLSTFDAVLAEKSAFSENCAMVVLPRYRVVDIDTEEDLELAERLFMRCCAPR